MSRRAWIPALLVCIVVVLAIAVRLHPAPFGVDRSWADAMSRMRSDGATFVARRISDPLRPFPFAWIVPVAIGGVVLWRAGRRSALAVLLIGELASWGTNNLIKLLIAEPRPTGGAVEVSGTSFPSGHTAFAAATAVLLVGLLVPPGRRTWWAVLGIALSLGMAWSRTYLGVHRLTDVVGGLAVGGSVGLIALVASRDRVERERSTRGSDPG